MRDVHAMCARCARVWLRCFVRATFLFVPCLFMDAGREEGRTTGVGIGAGLVVGFSFGP